MTDSMFIHMDALDNRRIDLKAFQEAFREKYRGLLIRPVTDGKQYCLEWSARNSVFQFKGMLDKRRVTFVIDYFNSPDRNRDLAELLLWLRSWFPADASVIFCDDSYSNVYDFRADSTQEDLLPLLA